jgi:hypothetical protein
MLTYLYPGGAGGVLRAFMSSKYSLVLKRETGLILYALEPDTQVISYEQVNRSQVAIKNYLKARQRKQQQSKQSSSSKRVNLMC